MNAKTNAKVNAKASTKVRHGTISAALFFLSLIFFLINIQFPRGYCFEEFHYVPAAKLLLSLSENINWEHPPLAKLLIALGIAIGGDRPFGWRLMSTVFGSLTLVGMYWWGIALFRSQRMALVAVGFTLVNQLLYVQARIAMLDTFMWAFVTFALAALTSAASRHCSARAVRRLVAFSGIAFGLAIACKWSAIVPALGVFIVVSIFFAFRRWTVTFKKPSRWTSNGLIFEDWYSPQTFHGLSWQTFTLRLVGLSLLAYFSTFLPLLALESPGTSLAHLPTLQKEMWDAQQRVVDTHRYMSSWLDWPLLSRPIWYAFDKEGSSEKWVRGVFLIGNPIVMLLGLMALLVCAWAWVARRDRAAFWILTCFIMLYLPWAVIPRKVAFYYYYYPAGMVLSHALAYALHLLESLWRPAHAWRLTWGVLALATLIFIYFFPILSAMRIPAESFRQWMWLSSWI